jgi:hypothetical protein
MAQCLTGDKLGALSARTRTFIAERPLPTGPAVSLGGQGGSTMGEVTVDDAVVMHGELGPALATFEATRMATGRKNALRIELNRASKAACSYNGCWRRSRKVPPTAPAGPRSVRGSARRPL